MSVADSSRRLSREKLESRLANEPMNPAGSMAMAGNYGLAGLSQNQANQIKQAQQTINQFNDQFKGNTSEPVTFKDIGQQFGEMGSKYRRPVDKDRYANKANLFNQGILGGGKIFVGPDGIPRLSFDDQVVRDPKTGAQMMSMMLPYMTAQAPTLSQLGGDIKRAFTGYNSLKYVDDDFQGPFPLSKSPGFNSRDLPYMQYTPGMFEGVNPLSLIPGVGTAMKAAEVVKSGVEQLWDKVREKPSQQTFPEFRGESENYFNNIDTGISQVDPNNMLVQIAKANEGRFDDTSTFQDQLANATAMNLNIPSPTDVAQTISDYYTAAAQGVNLNTPIGDININPLAEKVFLNGGIKELQEPGDIGYGGSFDPNTLDYNVGIGARLPYDVNFSAGASSSDIPGMSFSKNIGPVNTSFNLSEQGGSLGLNTVIDPLRTIFPGSSVGTPINIGASVDSRGNINPNVGFMVPFNSGGLGYMFK